VATERILAHLVKAQEATAPEIAEALGLKPTVAYRALYTLSSRELVEDTGRRRTGPSGRPVKIWRTRRSGGR
jgi:predicted ArsR family transcriptional regulator